MCGVESLVFSQIRPCLQVVHFALAGDRGCFWASLPALIDLGALVGVCMGVLVWFRVVFKLPTCNNGGLFGKKTVKKHCFQPPQTHKFSRGWSLHALPVLVQHDSIDKLIRGENVEHTTICAGAFGTC